MKHKFKMVYVTIIIAGVIAGIIGDIRLQALDHEVTPVTPIVVANHTWSFTQEDLEKALLFYLKANGEVVPEGKITTDYPAGRFLYSAVGDAATRMQLDVKAGVGAAYDKTGNPPAQKPKKAPTVLTMTVEEVQKP